VTHGSDRARLGRLSCDPMASSLARFMPPCAPAAAPPAHPLLLHTSEKTAPTPPPAFPPPPPPPTPILPPPSPPGAGSTVEGLPRTPSGGGERESIARQGGLAREKRRRKGTARELIARQGGLAREKRRPKGTALALEPRPLLRRPRTRARGRPGCAFKRQAAATSANRKRD
jgi:hypothetical protein